MGWVRLSDDFYDHTKFADAGPLALALWVAGLAWCNRNLSDGWIPRSRARMLLDFEGLAEVDGSSGRDVVPDDVIAMLVTVTLWDEEDGGYRYHDYHDYQPTSETVQANRLDISSKRREAGRKGGLTTQARKARSDEANEQTSSNGPGICLSKSEAPTPNPIKTYVGTDIKALLGEANAAAPVENSVDGRVVEAALAVLVERRMLASKAEIVNPAGYRHVTLAELRTEHATVLAELDHGIAWTPVMLADWLEPVPTRPPTKAPMPALPAPVAPLLAFHGSDCVCDGHGTDRTCDPEPTDCPRPPGCGGTGLVTAFDGSEQPCPICQPVRVAQ